MTLTSDTALGKTFPMGYLLVVYFGKMEQRDTDVDFSTGR